MTQDVLWIWTLERNLLPDTSDSITGSNDLLRLFLKIVKAHVQEHRKTNKQKTPKIPRKTQFYKPDYVNQKFVLTNTLIMPSNEQHVGGFTMNPDQQ